MEFDLSKYKPGTVDWLNEANRIANQQLGRDLTREEIRRLYSAAERAYTPNWTNPTTYRGTPGNIVNEGAPRTVYQTQRTGTAPRAQIQPYTPQVNARIVGGSPLQPRYTRPQPQVQIIEPRPVVQNALSTNVLPQSINPNVNIAQTVPTPPYRTANPQSVNVIDSMRKYQFDPQGWREMFNRYNPGTPSNGALNVKTNPEVRPTVQNPPVLYNKTNALKSAVSNPSAVSKWLGAGSALASSVPFYNAFNNPDATIGDRVLDFATGTAFASGLGSFVPPTLMIGPVPAGAIAQGAGKVGPWVGTGLSLIPRSYNNKEVQAQPQPVVQQPQPEKEEPQLEKPMSIADKVAYGANKTTGTNLPVGSDYTPNGLTDTQEMIIRIAKEEGVDPALALTVAGAESGFNTAAVSPAGAIGLMQLMPETAKGLGVDPYNPEQNVRGGLRYLRQQMQRYGNSLNLALAAYNAGPGAVDRYGGIPPYKETQNYVNTIASNKKKWDKVLSGTSLGQPTSPTARGNAIVNALIPQASAATTSPISYGSARGTAIGTNPQSAIPEPQADNTSLQMLLEYAKNQPSTSMDMNINGTGFLGGAGVYNPYAYLLPEELDLLNARNPYANISPEDYINLMSKYSRWQRAARAKDQALGNIYNRDTFSADGGLNPFDTINNLNKLRMSDIETQQKIYDTLMKRADARFMAHRYGMPFTSMSNNVGDVLQYIVKPTMEQQWKNQNRVPDTLMELIKKENEGEVTRKNTREQGRVDIAKDNNLWGNYRYPGMMNTLSSIEARNAADNQTEALGYWTEALKQDAINQRYYDLSRIGIPQKLAGSLAIALGYLPPNSAEAKQIIQYITSLTGLNEGAMPQSIINAGGANAPGVNNSEANMILQQFMGVSNGN